MNSNLEKYKSDLNKLIDEGQLLFDAMQLKVLPDQFEKTFKKHLKGEYESYLKKLPDFINNYQPWYSESLRLIKQLLPDRLNDFIEYYEKPKGRKELNHVNYVIEDYLQGVSKRSPYGETLASQSDALPQFLQQLNILISVKKRFESSLFDITQLVQADLFDSELDAASELNKNKFVRAAGAIAGVVLEKHLELVCNNHNLKLTKKNPTINDFNELLKTKNTIDVPTWRFIQHLGDLRNLCDHNKSKEPSLQEVEDLIQGVKKISKNLFYPLLVQV